MIRNDIFHIIGKKWSLPVIQKLQESEELRFNEIKNQLNQITPSNLSITLKELEDIHIISKKIYDNDNQNSSYMLTNYGKIVYQMSDLILLLGKNNSESKSKSHILQISDKIIQDVMNLKTSNTLEYEDIQNISKTIETLIKDKLEDLKNNVARYFVPIGTMCGVFSSFCIYHGLSHLDHNQILM